MHQSILKIIGDVLKHSRSNSMYTSIGFVCKCISHHVAKTTDQGIHQNYEFCNLIQAGGLEIKKKPEAADIYIFQFSNACNQLYNAVSQHHICIQCVLTTVMSDAEKHHTLLMLTSRLSHNPPPSSHSMANIRSAIDRTKIGCTCAYMQRKCDISD